MQKVSFVSRHESRCQSEKNNAEQNDVEKASSFVLLLRTQDIFIAKTRLLVKQL